MLTPRMNHRTDLNKKVLSTQMMNMSTGSQNIKKESDLAEYAMVEEDGHPHANYKS